MGLSSDKWAPSDKYSTHIPTYTYEFSGYNTYIPSFTYPSYSQYIRICGIPKERESEVKYRTQEGGVLYVWMGIVTQCTTEIDVLSI